MLNNGENGLQIYEMGGGRGMADCDLKRGWCMINNEEGRRGDNVVLVTMPVT